MPDLLFDDTELAALYDAMNARPLRDDFDFYLPMVMAADAVLDVGCGTGAMLHEARAAGHSGRLCGLDPAAGMLAQARRRADIEWVQGDLQTAGFAEAFDLVVMTGHAFQVFIDDDEIARVLSAVRRALRTAGVFAFETRNPDARAWEGWDLQQPRTVETAGGPVEMTRRVTAGFDGRTVSFAHTFRGTDWPAPRTSHSTLRFLDAGDLTAALDRAGLQVEACYGDFDLSPLTAASPEIVILARGA